MGQVTFGGQMSIIVSFSPCPLHNDYSLMDLEIVGRSVYHHKKMCGAQVHRPQIQGQGHT